VTAEYIIHAKLKNNLLLSRILAKSESVAAFCRESGLSQSAIGELINLKAPALLKDGHWCSLAMKLSEIFGTLPEDLFSEEQQTVQLQTNEAFIEITRQQMLNSPEPFELIESRELLDVLLKNAKLTDRQRTVLQLRFKDDQTLEETAKSMNVSRERVRQHEMKAIRNIQKAAHRLNVFGN